MLARSVAESDRMHTLSFIFMILSVNFLLIAAASYYEDSQVNRRYPHGTGHLGRWIVCLQSSAVFELCLWPFLQMCPYALDQSHSLL